MCGFAGVCSFDRDAREWNQSLPVAAQLIRHRGPDDESYFSSRNLALGFRRLKIIDLTDMARQPMTDASDRHTIVFNGEIYNYIELREELQKHGHQFGTRSDTEVLLHGLMEWGDQCLQRLNGMFAFAWWDANLQKLMLARDRFGEKPLFYARVKNQLLFASEIKALFPLMRPTPKPNLDAIYSFLEYRDLEIAPHTFFSGVQSVRPASRVWFGQDGWQEDAYWTLEAGDQHISEPADKFRELFLNSLRLRTRSDVPVGTCLSGGLDSSAIVCGLAHLEDQKRIEPTSRKTFSACYSQYDEMSQIRATVERSKSACFITRPQPESLTEIGELIAFHDEPFHSFAAFASFAVMKLAKENGVSVVLNGQGADESLAGYGGYMVPYLSDVLFSGDLASTLKAARGARDLTKKSASQLIFAALFYALRSWIAPVARSAGLKSFSPNSLCYGHLRPEFSVRATRLGQSRHEMRSGFLKESLFESMFIAKLPIYLRVEDRNSMANSIESRLPFLDHELVEFVFQMPASQFMADGKNKKLLRDGMFDLLPPEVTGRTDKFGFPIPQSSWLFDHLNPEIRDMLQSPSSGLGEVLCTDGLASLYQKHAREERPRNDRSRACGFWFRVVVLELWFQHVRNLEQSVGLSTLVGSH